MKVRVWSPRWGDGYKDYEANHFSVDDHGVLAVCEDGLDNVKAIYSRDQWTHAEVVDNNSTTV